MIDFIGSVIYYFVIVVAFFAFVLGAAVAVILLFQEFGLIAGLFGIAGILAIVIAILERSES